MKGLTVFDVLPAGAQDAQSAEIRLITAYKAFIAGHPSSEDCEIILVDLASISGYYNTTLMDAPADQVKFVEGMRTIVGRIFRMADTTMTEIRALQQSVLREQQARGE